MADTLIARLQSIRDRLETIRKKQEDLGDEFTEAAAQDCLTTAEELQDSCDEVAGIVESVRQAAVRILDSAFAIENKARNIEAGKTRAIQVFNNRTSVISDQLDTIEALFASAPPRRSEDGGRRDTAVTTQEEENQAGGLDLSRFFSDVCESLVRSQSQLNALSLDYSRSVPPGVPQAYFAIPNVKAEVKVGFSQTDEKKLNLILFSKKGQREEYGESTVSFDLVSAPPPPGDELYRVPPFLPVGAEKTRLLEAIARLDKGPPGPLDPSASLLIRTHQTIESSRYLAICTGSPVPSGPRPAVYVLPLREQDDELTVDEHMFNQVKKARPSVIEIPPATDLTDPGQRLTDLREFFVGLVDFLDSWLDLPMQATPHLFTSGVDRADLVKRILELDLPDDWKKTFEPAAERMLALRQRPGERLLVLWPAWKPRRDPAQFSVLAVKPLPDESIELDPSIFSGDESPPPFVWIEKQMPSDAQGKIKLINALGDVLVQMVHAFNDWLGAVQSPANSLREQA